MLHATVDRQFDEFTTTSAIRTLWATGLLITFPALFRPETATYYLTFSGVLLVMAASLTWLRSRLAHRVLARAVVACGTGLAAVSAVLTGGSQSPAFQSYAVVIVGAVWLVLEPAAAIAVVVATVAAGAGMTWAGVNGWLPDPMVVHDPWSRWAATAAACVLIAAVQRIELVRLRGALDSAHTDLADRERLQLEAAQSEQRYAEIVATVPGVVFQFEIREDGCRGFTFISDGARWLFGVSPKAALVDARAIFGLLDRAQLPALEASISLSYSTLSPWEFEGSIITTTGEPKWVRGHSLPSRLADGTVRCQGVFTDVTARVAAQRALHASETALKQALSLTQAALESTADGLLVVDMAGRVTGYNQKFLSLWRVPAAIADRGDNEQLLAHAASQVLDPEGFLAKVREMNDSTVSVSFDTIAFTDGRRFERYTQPQVVDGVTVGRVASFRDVTARVEEERRRTELELQLQHSQKMEALGTLAGGIAHDFNNLLMVILGQAELAQLHPDDDAQRLDSLREISEAGSRASDLVRQIRDFSQPQPAERAVMAVGTAVEQAVTLLRSTIPKSIDLTVALDRGVTMFADVTQVHQVVTNLVVNAHQALANGKGRIDVALDVVPSSEVPPSVPEPFADRYARLTVSDTGCGIAPDVLPRVFDPFFTTKSAGRGSGLGLSVVHGIVRQHGGGATVESVEGQGTSVAVYWPALPSHAVAPASAVRPAGRVADGVTERHILLVDDEEGIVKVVAGSLELMGYRVTACTDPREALERFRATPRDFDIVLTDQSMPHMTGLELGRILLGVRPDIVLVLFTGFNAELSPETIRAIGFRALINKPMAPSALAEVLHRASVSA